MHQRRGKTYRAGPMDGPDRINTRSLAAFFEEAATQVEEPFYFEQLADYFRNHYSPKKGLDSPIKVLGL
jgi:hypothetical protein